LIKLLQLRTVWGGSVRDRLKAIIPAKYLESIFIAQPLDERMEILIFPPAQFGCFWSQLPFVLPDSGIYRRPN